MNSEMKIASLASSMSATSATREQISRWMDGDIEAHEIDLAMGTMSTEQGRYCWAEMHYVGDCIRGLEDTKAGCADAIRAAISGEPAILAPAGKRLRAQAKERSVASAMAYLGRGGRAWATAAAVAAVGFVGTVVYKDQVAAPQLASIAPTVSVAGADGIQGTAPTKVRADFNAYLQAHQESADISSMSPMRQYMRPAVSVQAQ